jgi:hypothetical protein
MQASLPNHTRAVSAVTMQYQIDHGAGHIGMDGQAEWQNRFDHQRLRKEQSHGMACSVLAAYRYGEA